MKKILNFLNKFYNNCLKKILLFLYNYKYVIIPFILGALGFIMIYGIKVINPLDIDWILSRGGDITQHYLGWEFYRISPWTFPIGMQDAACFPYSVSVIFTDSIPLFAVFFKLFSNFLPEHFQFLGLFGIICFALNGATSAIVLKKFIKSDLFVILLSLFFIFSPIAIYRMYYHTALAGHFLIFICFALVLYKDKFSLKQTIIYWGLLGVLCSTIHMYFLLFNGMILVGYMLYELLSKNYKKVIFSFISYILFAALILFILGGFSSPTSPFGRNDLSAFSFNLNGFINPYDYSKFLTRLETAPGLLQEEGFSYLGLGLIVGVSFSIVIAVLGLIYRIITKKKINIDWKLVISILLVCLISIWFATIHQIYFGETLLFKYEIPDIINKYFGVFRTNGRAIWILYYIVIFLCFYLLSRNSNAVMFGVLIIMLLFLQYKDINHVFEWKHWEFTEYNFEPKLKDERWKKLFQEDFKVLVLPSDFPTDLDKMYLLDTYAIKYGKYVNRFNITQGMLDNLIREELNEFTNNPTDDYMFVIDKNAYFRYDNMDLNYYELEDVYIAYSKELPYLDTINSKELTFETNYFTEFQLDFEEKYKITIKALEEDIYKEDFDIYFINFKSFEIIDNTITLIIEDSNDFRLNMINQKQIEVKISEIKE